MHARAARLAGFVMLLALAPSLLGACGIVAPATDLVTVTATDPAADIYADGVLLGKGTAVARVKSNDKHTFTAVLGNRTAVATTDSKISTIGMIDGISGIFLLIPLIGLATPGAWDVDRDSVLLVLPPQ